MHGTALVLTATIRPRSSLVAVASPERRLQEYKHQLEYYLCHSKAPVFFLENSDYPLDHDEDFCRWQQESRLRLMRFTPSAEFLKGKGYQEFEMLDQFVERAPEVAHFLKISGRYRVRNFTRLLSSARSQINIDLHLRKRVAITGCFACKRSFYRQHISGLYAHADDSRGRFIEHVLFDKLHREPVLLRQAQLLPRNARYAGVAGSTGLSLHRHPLKMALREAERQCNRLMQIPYFWVEY